MLWKKSRSCPRSRCHPKINPSCPFKVDREERPDIDDVYMNYVQATTGGGGWPLNVFLTPALEPVFGGTYWPGPNTTSQTRLGADGPNRLCGDLGKASRCVAQPKQARCLDSAKEITRQLLEFAEEGTHTHQAATKRRKDLEFELLEEAFKHFSSRYDSVHGGFSRAPISDPSEPQFSATTGMYPECRERHCWTREVCVRGNG